MNSTTASAPSTREAINMQAFLDRDGFFREPSAWTPELAEHLAHLDGLPALTSEHWVIIDALRDHYSRFGATPPAFAHLCTQMHRDMYCVVRLFRSEREAWRLAGLPDPGEEAKAYL